MIQDLSAATRSDFIEQLNELRLRSGNPTLHELQRLSQRIGGRDGQYRELAKSTTHDILTHKRKRLPEWWWVSLFVGACHLAAEHHHLQQEPLGNLDDWNARWRAARACLPAPPYPETTQPHPRAREPLHHEPAPWEPAPRERASLEWASLSLDHPSLDHPSLDHPSLDYPSLDDQPLEVAGDEQRQWERQAEIYGRTGARLLSQLDPNDAHDLLRMAVIALLRGHEDEARAWLRPLAGTGQAEAVRLSDAAAPQLVAAELAYRYGREYLVPPAGRVSVAMFFFRLAAAHGHAEAAYQLALHRRRREEEDPAAAWFGVAAVSAG
ncbi:hypothetical protein [Nonomuraea typhae]|uniref:hypothetical protein n=1 Tax=Nonomuraea typhae TaxID=2603600 RepID=UPI0012FA561A|nr:hypothetical protein [Nonomuraea typhae]